MFTGLARGERDAEMSVGEAFQSARLLHAGRTADGRSQVAEVGLTDLEADLRTTTDRQLRPLLVQTLCKETHIALSLKCMVPFWLHDDALTKQKENPRSIIFCLQALASRLGNMCHTVVFFFFACARSTVITGAKTPPLQFSR